jgi:hypothetical protein
MERLNLEDVVNYVEQNIGIFHQKRIQSIADLTLKLIAERKNPYLFKAKNVLTADEIIEGILSATVSSGEETIFGDWLEGLAIFINHKVYEGWKSGIPGIDLEFDMDGYRYIVTIKSGPNWGNSSAVKKLKTDFTSAQRTLRTSNSQLNIRSVNGCCYGICNKPDRGDYFKFCGQKFWEFISGNTNLYCDLIEPLGHLARERNDEFLIQYANKKNTLIREFTNNFCTVTGAIDWDKLVRFNSSINNRPRLIF